MIEPVTLEFQLVLTLKLLNIKDTRIFMVINHVIVLSVPSRQCDKKNYVNWILNTRDLEMDIG